MRKISKVQNNEQIKRLLLDQTENGVFLFLYDRQEDSPCKFDLWFETLEDLYRDCQNSFEIQEYDWIEIPDVPEGCHQDWIASVRVKGRNVGKPLFGKFESLENGVWVDIDQQGKRVLL